MDRRAPPPDQPAAARPSPDARPAGGASASELRLYLRDTAQLFNSMDPAPFRERDLDPNAESYIVEWAREAPRRGPLGLAIVFDKRPATAEDRATIEAAVHEYFRQRALATRQRLRWLFRTGRISLLVGFAFVAFTVFAGELLAGLSGAERYMQMIVDSLVIGAWVALWRPLEIFLYDWWPIRDEARLYERLSRAGVRLESTVAAAAPAPALGVQ